MLETNLHKLQIGTFIQKELKTTRTINKKGAMKKKMLAISKVKTELTMLTSASKMRVLLETQISNYLL